MNREGLMGDVVVSGYIGHSNREMLVFNTG